MFCSWYEVLCLLFTWSLFGEKFEHEGLQLPLLCQRETWELESCVLQLLEICFDLFSFFLMAYKDTGRIPPTHRDPWQCPTVVANKTQSEWSSPSAEEVPSDCSQILNEL